MFSPKPLAEGTVPADSDFIAHGGCTVSASKETDSDEIALGECTVPASKVTDSDKMLLGGCTVPASKETDSDKVSPCGCTVPASKETDRDYIALCGCTVPAAKETIKCTAAVAKEPGLDCTETTANKEPTGDGGEQAPEGNCIKPTIRESAKVCTESACTVTSVDKVIPYCFTIMILMIIIYREHPLLALTSDTINQKFMITVREVEQKLEKVNTFIII